MKHFLKVNSNGEIIGTVRTKGGFGDEHNLCDPNNQHPIAVAQRRLNANNPNFSCHVLYECPCPSDHITCPCLDVRKMDVYVEDGVLVDKPALTLLVDGVVQGATMVDEPLTLTPGTKVMLKLQGSAPDGHQVTAIGRGSAQIIRNDAILVFNGGETQELELTAPAHGMLGWVAGKSKYVRPFRLQVRGWL